MKLSTVFAVIVTTFVTAATATLISSGATVDARDLLTTNGERMARNLPPKPPVRRNPGTPVYGTPLSKRSVVPNTCSGVSLCCSSLTNASNPDVTIILQLLAIHAEPNTPVGLECFHKAAGLSCSPELSLCCDSFVAVDLGIQCTPSGNSVA